MLHVRYSLEEFVSDLQGLVAAQPDQATLFDRGSALLERFVRDPEALPTEFRVPSGKGRRANHGSYALHRSDGLFVSAVVWGAGDGVGPHDHLTWGMIGVMGNGIEETRFRRLDDGGDPARATLVKDRTALVKPGEVSLLSPQTDEIHEMRNDSHRPTVEIHVYGRDLVGLPRHAFDLETGEVRPFTSGRFDNC